MTMSHTLGRVRMVGLILLVQSVSLGRGTEVYSEILVFKFRDMKPTLQGTARTTGGGSQPVADDFDGESTHNDDTEDETDSNGGIPTANCDGDRFTSSSIGNGATAFSILGISLI